MDANKEIAEISVRNPPPLLPEVGDSQLQQEMKLHFNNLMDALKWYREQGIVITVNPKPSGYSVILKKE